MSDSVQPHRWKPTRLPHPWDSPGKNTGVGCHFLLQCMKVKSESEVTQSCPTLSDPMDYSLPGSSVHGVFQARVLEWGAMTNLDSILKSRDITLPTKVHLVKAMVFPVVMHGCQSWTIKRAEHRRIDAFELWSWRRLLRVPWTTGQSNQSILKEISPEYSLEGLMLKLKLQYFGHLMQRVDPLEKTLMLGKIEGRSRRGRQRMVGWHHRLNGHEFEQALGDGEGQGSLVCCSPWGCKELDTTVTEQQQQSILKHKKKNSI